MRSLPTSKNAITLHNTRIFVNFCLGAARFFHLDIFRATNAQTEI